MKHLKDLAIREEGQYLIFENKNALLKKQARDFIDNYDYIFFNNEEYEVGFINENFDECLLRKLLSNDHFLTVKNSSLESIRQEGKLIKASIVNNISKAILDSLPNIYSGYRLKILTPSIIGDKPLFMFSVAECSITYSQEQITADIFDKSIIFRAKYNTEGDIMIPKMDIEGHKFSLIPYQSHKQYILAHIRNILKNKKVEKSNYRHYYFDGVKATVESKHTGQLKITIKTPKRLLNSTKVVLKEKGIDDFIAELEKSEVFKTFYPI